MGSVINLTSGTDRVRRNHPQGHGHSEPVGAGDYRKVLRRHAVLPPGQAVCPPERGHPASLHVWMGHGRGQGVGAIRRTVPSGNSLRPDRQHGRNHLASSQRTWTSRHLEVIPVALPWWQSRTADRGLSLRPDQIGLCPQGLSGRVQGLHPDRRLRRVSGSRRIGRHHPCRLHGPHPS